MNNINTQRAIVSSSVVEALPYEPASIMEYHDYLVRQAGETLLVGYLSYDDNCENPLEDCDGMGTIYSSHRHDRHEHRSYQEAYGLDSYWSANLELVEEHPKVFRQLWINVAASHVEFQVWCDETGRKANPDHAYYLRRAKQFWREAGFDGVSRDREINEFAFTEDVKQDAWQQLRVDRQIGDPDVVVLDCYDHGGQSWSIAGHGIQCRWDTSSGAGVWVPDDEARKEIDRRQAIYAYGSINQVGKMWEVVRDYAYGFSQDPAPFAEWHEALTWLEQFSKGKKPTPAMLATGRDRARMEICNEAMEVFNNWLSGQCYGTIVATFHNIGSESAPEWEFSDSEDCWGYVGDDCAMSELTDIVIHTTIQ